LPLLPKIYQLFRQKTDIMNVSMINPEEISMTTEH